MTLLVVYQVLPVEEDNQSTSAIQSIYKERGGHPFLGMPESAAEHTWKITRGMTEHFIVPGSLVRRCSFLTGGQF